MSLYRTHRRLVSLLLLGRKVQVPENNLLLRCFQYLCPDSIPYGAFCWNEECQNCRIQWRHGAAGTARVALSCKLIVREGMEITSLAPELQRLMAPVLPLSAAGK